MLQVTNRQLTRRAVTTGLGAAAIAVPAIAVAMPGEAANPWAAFGGGPRCELQIANGDHFAPEYPKGSIFVVDPDRAPKDGDLVHAELRFRNAKPHRTISTYFPQSGHDSDGRFCTPGTPDEIVCIVSPIKYRRSDLERGHVEILGTVVAAISKF